MLEFNSTISESCFEVVILEDEIPENAEEFQLRLSTSDPVLRIPEPLATLLIMDIDGKHRIM